MTSRNRKEVSRQSKRGRKLSTEDTKSGTHTEIVQYERRYHVPVETAESKPKGNKKKV